MAKRRHQSNIQSKHISQIIIGCHLPFVLSVRNYNDFQGFYDRNGELDYDKFLIALNNQSFRRRWLKSAIIYISDWINHIAEPEAFKK